MDTETQKGEDPVMTEAETGVMYPGRPRTAGHQQQQEKARKDTALATQRVCGPDTLSVDFQPPERELTRSCCLSLLVCGTLLWLP